MKLNPRECPHNLLQFFSGAYYIVCRDCQQYWMSITHGDQRDPEAGRDQPKGARVPPSDGGLSSI